MTKSVVDWRSKRERNLAGGPTLAGQPLPVREDAGHPGADEDATRDAEAHRRRLIAKMSNDDQRIVETLERVRAVYVRCNRDKLLTTMMTAFHRMVVAKKKDGSAPGGIFFITGESGAGKSSAIDEMLRHHPILQPERYSFGTVTPYVSVSMKGVTTVHLLARRIMRAAGYPIRKSAQGEIWDELSDWLKARHIHLVHIDETQHLMRKTERDSGRKSLADALKGAMEEPTWPVSFVLSGLPMVTELARLDEQFERRNMMIELPDVGEDDRSLIETIIRDMSRPAELECEALIRSDVPERIAHSAKYRYGRICQVVFAGIDVALAKGDTSLLREHFALAFLRVSHAREREEHNIFLVDDWHRLPSGAFILDRGDK